MRQRSLGQTGFELFPKKTRKREFLEEMERVVPWEVLIGLIEPYAPKGKNGRPPFAVSIMLRLHFLQQWFGLSDPALEEALHDIPLYREFAGLDAGISRLPDETTILRFRHLLEKHDLSETLFTAINTLLTERGLLLKRGTAVDATLINAPSSTKNQEKKRDDEMHSTKKGQQYYFGMKAHIGVDADSGLVHTVTGTAANVHDVTQAHELLHGEEHVVFGDSGYRGVEKREENQDNPVTWHIAMMPSKRKALAKDSDYDQLLEKIEKLKASVRAKVEHPFRVIKRQFGYTKVRYKGLRKNTAQLITLFALSNLWMVRKALLRPIGEVRP